MAAELLHKQRQQVGSDVVRRGCLAPSRGRKIPWTRRAAIGEHVSLVDDTGVTSGEPLGDGAPSRLRRGMAGKLGLDLGPLRRSRDFGLLYAGQAASFAGAMIGFVAMPFQAYRLSHSSLVVGLLSFTELIPLLAAGILGGALADAVERRRMIVTTECCLCAGSAALAANALLWHQLWVLFVLGGLTTGVSGLQRPSVEVLVPALVAREDLAAASALSGLLGNAAAIAGPLAAGWLIATAGLPVAYGVNGATGVLALAAFTRMRPSPPAPGADRPSLRSTLDGLRYARSRPELMGTYLIDIGAMFFGAPFALFPQIASGLGGPAVLGLLYAAPSAGGIIVSLTSRWTSRVHRHGRAIALAVCGWGASIAAFGFAPDLPLAVIALAAAGGSDMISGLFRMTMWNQTIPAALRGRLAGIEMISYTTGEPVGNLESGLVASLTGSVRIAVVSGGALSLVGALAVTVAMPALWRYDSRDTPAAGPDSPAAAGAAG
jgi:MFS family permease